MVFDDLKKELSGAIMDLKPAPIPDEVMPTNPGICMFVDADGEEIR